MQVTEMSDSVFPDRRTESVLQEQLISVTYFDQLTGLYNRTMARNLLDALITEASGRNSRVAVLDIDLDGFRAINDLWGSDAGDRVLREIASRLSGLVRHGDIVARWGSDEFIVILPGAHEDTTFARPLRQIERSFSEPVEHDGRSLRVTASTGLAIWPQDGRNAQQLLRNVETALGAAKVRGSRQTLRFDPSMGAEVKTRVDLESQLADALARNQLDVFFQPIVELASRRLIGAEALIRWNHPQQGMIPPGTFIPIAEQSGQIIEVGQVLLRSVILRLDAWRDRYGANFSVAANMSAREISDPHYLPTLDELLRTYRIAPEHIKLELTETAILSDLERARSFVRAARDLGIVVALDDFGTGFSSLSLLQDLEIDILKIDGSFTQRIRGDRKSDEIVRAVISLGEALDLQVIAEGIETEAQLDRLLAYGCRYGQGFLFEQPITGGVFAERWLTPGAASMAK